MKWTKFNLETRTEAVDLISSMLSDIGIEGIEIKDKVPLSEEDKKQMFVDILPVVEEDDGTATVSFYIDSEQDTDQILNQVKEGLKELSEFVSVGSGKIEISETQDLDWVNNWKQYFKPFRIDETIVIKPTWEILNDRKETDLVIELDPGTSFGTGSHETTKLCIIGLKKYLKPDSIVLDAGTGSGILSIIAKKLGAREVLGIDIDSHATDSAIENAKVNGLNIKEGNLNFLTGNIIEDGGIRLQIGKEKYDIVVANILADVIIPLSDVIGENLKPDGIFISSGIINTKENAVKEALLRNNFIIEEINHMGDWVSFVAKKK
ncbi:MAG: 50S ribosomal protein L11 methyltransferase [Clostridiales bacterium]|jgi:ribosomal protein L11 methyltransferase|nr:50S ribosomal protein L11 methyltransferase [Clostridiales bacterium]